MRDRSRTYIYADIECRYHRARMSIGITSRGDILLSVLARVYRFAFESRRLKGYKRTDPCVSPLFPLIFPHENPQSVRAASLSSSVPLTLARTNRIETLAPPEERRRCALLPYLCSTWETAVDSESRFPAALSELPYLHD